MKCKICDHPLIEKPLLKITKPDRFEAYVGADVDTFQRTWHRCSFCSVAQAVYYNGMSDKLASIADNYFEIDFGTTTSKDRYERIMRLPNEGSDNFFRVKRIADFYDQNRFGETENPSIMDIGGGLGVFMAKFLEVNPHFTGVMIEPDKKSAAHIDDSFPFEHHANLFKGQEMFKRNFNIVCLNKVVEHIERPHQLLRDIISALCPKTGILYIELPDENNIFFKPPHDNSLGSLHHHLYNIKSLNYLLEETGYTTLQMERILEPSGKISIYAFACPKEVVKSWLTNK